MPQPLLPARFQPQQWINDDAVDSADEIEFDAASAFMSLTRERMPYVVKQILRGRHDIDDLRSEDAEIAAHDGPFTISVEPADIVAFLALHDFHELQNLEAKDLGRIRHADIRRSAPTGEELCERLKDHDEHLGYPRSDWRYEVGNGDTSLGYWDWLASTVEAETETLAAENFDEWDRFDDGAWFMRMPEMTVDEILHGEPRSIYLRRDGSSYDVTVGEAATAGGTWPSLSLAKIGGAAIAAAAEERRPKELAAELGIDEGTFDVAVEEGAVIVSPKGADALPALVIEKGRTFLDLGAEHEEVAFDSIAEGVAALKEHVAPSIPKP